MINKVDQILLSMRMGIRAMMKLAKSNIGFEESTLDLGTNDQGLNASFFPHHFLRHFLFFGNVTSPSLALVSFYLENGNLSSTPEDNVKMFCKLFPEISFILKLNSFLNDNSLKTSSLQLSWKCVLGTQHLVNVTGLFPTCDILLE